MRTKYTINTVCVAIGICLISPTTILAQPMLIPFSPVNHPLSSPTLSRTKNTWNTAKGSWGETFVEGHLKLRGFKEVYEPKFRGGQGIDRIAIKRNAQGLISEVKFVEVKTTNAKPKLGNTKNGPQLSPSWLKKHLVAMRKSGDPALRKLALEIAAFRRQTGVRIENMGELYHISTKTGKYRIINPITEKILAEQSIHKNLKVIAKKSKQMQPWAKASLEAWEQIRTTTMTKWVAKIPPPNAPPVLTAAKATSQSFRQLARRGPVIAVILIEGYDTHHNIADYRQGKITRQQFHQAMIRTSGGVTGAWIGAKTGAATGAWIGSAGGPWGTGIGAVVGGAIGGAGGYFAGSYATGYGASAWYNRIDQRFKDAVCQSIIDDGFIPP